MSDIFDNRLRHPVEFLAAVVLGGLAALLALAPHAVFPLMPGLARTVAAVFAAMALLRAWEGLALLRYRRQLRALPRFELPARRIPVSCHKLYLGRGFPWDERHSQRLVEARAPHVRRWLEPGPPTASPTPWRSSPCAGRRRGVPSPGAASVCSRHCPKMPWPRRCAGRP